jgi:hypothetical protein
MGEDSPNAFRSGGPATESDLCSSDFLLCQVKAGEDDKLGNKVLEILWCGIDYVIYRTAKGVFINFSDCAKREKQQRAAFTAICPELCELRFLTHEMRGRPWTSLRRLFRKDEADTPSNSAAASLFDHNIAQALMLLMEGKEEEAKSIAAAALEMAVKRSTNDNTIRYVTASIAAWVVASLMVGAIYLVAGAARPAVQLYCLVAFFGVLGAMFSVATRVSSFRAKPCQQSNMNYVMARLRIGIGLLSAIMLYLLVGRLGSGAFIQPDMLASTEGSAIIGFLGGFAERLVPTVFRRAAEAFDQASGTPVQQARTQPLPSAGLT